MADASAEVKGLWLPTDYPFLNAYYAKSDSIPLHLWKEITSGHSLISEGLGRLARCEQRRAWKDDPKTFDLSPWHIIRGLYYNQEWDFRFFTSNISPGDAVLDYGCGVGYPLWREKARLKNIALADIPSPAFDYVREEYGDRAKYIELPSILPGNHYKHIICLDVLEHIPDPVTVFRSLLDSLQERGNLLIWYEESDQPGHISGHLKQDCYNLLLKKCRLRYRQPLKEWWVKTAAEERKKSILLSPLSVIRRLKPGRLISHLLTSLEDEIRNTIS